MHFSDNWTRWKEWKFSKYMSDLNCMTCILTSFYNSVFSDWSELISTAVWEEENLIPLTFCSSGTKTFLAFLIIGCGFSSSWENLCLRGLNSSPPGTLDRTRSVGSGWKLMSTSMASGSIGEGVLRSAESSRGKSKLGHKTGKRQWTRWPDFTPLLWNLLGSYVGFIALSRLSHKDILSLQTLI